VKTKSKWLIAAAATLAVAGLIGVEITAPSSQACAAAAKMSFAEDVLPVFRGR
jgi:hypothetical protein